MSLKRALTVTDEIPEAVLRRGLDEQALLDEINKTAEELKYYRKKVRELERFRASLFVRAREEFQTTYRELARYGLVKPDRVSEIVSNFTIEYEDTAQKELDKYNAALRKAQTSS